jgi:hypothetical protein
LKVSLSLILESEVACVGKFCEMSLISLNGSDAETILCEARKPRSK